MQKRMFRDKFGLTDLVLSGQKTQTRRIVCQKLVDKYDELLENYEIASYNIGVACIIKSKEKFLLEHSPYRIGEEVAVAQSYEKAKVEFVPFKEGCGKWGNPRKLAGWTNKMFVRAELMPHTIKITNIRVERLQDISDEDCLAEGIKEVEASNNWGNSATHTEYSITYYNQKSLTKQLKSIICPQEAFAALIDKINGYGTWESNPYVWVYDFELVK